ncbi:MAG: TIGR03545 family protein [Bdellovibrionales bacterium]
MTNSTDNNQSQEKPKKAKGPIRFEAIIPTILITVLVGAYMTYFFDANLRSGIEWVGSRVHGAEINIANISTSFINGNMQIDGIQITDKTKPEQNMLQIGQIRFGLVWDALLRAKFVVSDAAIEGIAIHAKRKRPGQIFKKDDPSRKEINKIETAALDITKEKYNKNILGDLATVAGGVDPNSQLKEMQADLGAEKKINDLKLDIKNKENAWKERIAQLPGQDKFKALESQFKALKFDSNNPQQFLKDIQEADRIIKEADQHIKTITTTANELNGEVNAVGKELGQVDQWIQQDIADLQNRLNIPSLNVGDLSKSLFLNLISEKIAPYQKYIVLAKEYMPPPKDKNAKAADAPMVTPRQRGQGRTYRFPVTATSYPLFWLQKGTISSKSNEGGFSGDISGTIANFTTNPRRVGKPATLEISGDFPHQQVMGLKANVVIDNRQQPTKSTLSGSVASFPMEPLVLSDSKDLKFKVTNLVGRSSFAGQMVDDRMAVNIKNIYDQVKYDIQSNNKDVEQIFVAAANGVPRITLDAGVKGKFSSLAWSVDSNLGRELGSGLKKQVQEKIDQAKKQLEAYVYGRVGKEKQALQAQYNQLQSQINNQVNGKKQQLENEKKQLMAQLDQKKKSGENQQKQKVEEKSKKLMNDLKKKLKF